MSAPRFYIETAGEVQPLYEVARAKGGGTRPANIGDARKLGAVPSVTTILNIIAKPGLERWKRRQTVEAALTLPRFPDETDEAFMDRIAEDSEAYSNKAADLGSILHDNIAAWIKDRTTLPHPLNEQCFAWMADNIIEVKASEKSLIHPLMKYGGRMDLHCELKGIGNSVVDFKSQAIKKEPQFYDDWALQLAAYAQIVQHRDSLLQMPTLVSIVINSQASGPVFCHQWENPNRHFQQFWNAFELWKYYNEWETT